MSLKRGALIVLEGIDRSGKSTQCEKLVKTLKDDGKNVELMKLPDRTTETGKVIDKFLKKEFTLEDHAVHLLFTANQWEAVPKIEKLIEEGTTVVLDRYAYSGVAYRVAKGLDMNWCKRTQSGFPRPDLVLFLDISIKDAAKRANYGEEVYETTEFQEKVSKSFELLKDSNWQKVDAGKSIEEVHEVIKRLTLTAMKECIYEKLSKLWNN